LVAGHGVGVWQPLFVNCSGLLHVTALSALGLLLTALLVLGPAVSHGGKQMKEACELEVKSWSLLLFSVFAVFSLNAAVALLGVA
jgi:hypothetical protein